jgi:hypothetical protein
MIGLNSFPGRTSVSMRRLCFSAQRAFHRLYLSNGILKALEKSPDYMHMLDSEVDNRNATTNAFKHQDQTHSAL